MARDVEPMDKTFHLPDLMQMEVKAVTNRNLAVADAA
jgi:hypothetical protein